MKNSIWGLLLLLIILHQADLFGGDGSLVFGFLPISLVYHIGISLAAAAVWFLLTKFNWPDNLESIPDESTDDGGQV